MGEVIKNDAIQGRVLEIQRMSTEDGPGIRTTVFLKGCPLKCSWCHNPESISPDPQVHWIGSRCIGCKTCLDACPERAISFTKEDLSIDRKTCTGCGICAEECPSTALELLGENWTPEDLVTEIIKDKTYFEKSGGGVTLSGGEPTMQAKFCLALLKGLRAKGIHTALDTCGLCSKESLDLILPYVDLLLYDIKEIDPLKHERFTGSSNDRILKNLIYISSYIKTHVYPKHLWIRTPVIPSATAREGNIRGIAHFIATHLGGVITRWELCSFNNLCRDKYARLGRKWRFHDSELLSSSEIRKLADVARSSGVKSQIVHWSGATKIENSEKGYEDDVPESAKGQ